MSSEPELNPPASPSLVISPTGGNAGSSSEPKKSQKKLGPHDFLFGVTLGEGAYARVIMGKLKKPTSASSEGEFAIKIMEKRFIKKENKVKFVMMEKKVLSTMQHDGIVKLHFTFQDHEHLFMAMELCPGGELLKVIRDRRTENEDKGIEDVGLDARSASFYAAEIVQVLEYMHSKDVVHRDLKPENILLTEKGHLKVADFGTAKDENDKSGRHNTFCGTAEYVSPEVLRDQDAGKGVDLWALGVVIYQLLVGRCPFRGGNEYQTFNIILKFPEDFEYPSSLSDTARDLIERLLVQNPEDRLGAGEAESANSYGVLKAHPFFEHWDVDTVRKQDPPFTPDLSHFPECTMDGAEPDWIMGGVPTELQMSANVISLPLQTLEPEVQQQDVHERDVQTMPRTGSNVGAAITGIFDSISHGLTGDNLTLTTREAENPEMWKEYIREGETILKCGLVHKRRGLFSKKRQLVLTNRPRLFYIDPFIHAIKGEVEWKAIKCSLLKEGDKKFDVVTDPRTYHFIVEEGARSWCDAINGQMGN